MHPAYGANHAIVAGACTTLLKALFDLYDDSAGDLRPKLDFENPNGRVFPSVAHGQMAGGSPFCIHSDPPDLTVEGELNKLAANIAIGRNFAGVHYYTDYYDSLRLGERIAVRFLMDRMLACPDSVAMSLRDFDGTRIDLNRTESAGQRFVQLKVDGGDEGMARDAWWALNQQEFSARS